METRLFKLVLTLKEPMLGTVPKNAAIYRTYIADKATEAAGDEECATVPVSEDKGWTGFHTDADGPFMYDYMVKGFLKEASSTFNGLRGVKNLRSKVEHFVFVEPRRIRLPAIAPEPLERPLRAMTAQGPRVALTRSDLIPAGGVITFNIRMIDGPISRPLLCDLLDYGAFQGLGQWRNASYGSFTYTIEDV
jgi:hypothetical protein